MYKDVHSIELWVKGYDNIYKVATIVVSRDIIYAHCEYIHLLDVYDANLVYKRDGLIYEYKQANVRIEWFHKVVVIR